jgi:hypothetical protein
MPLVMKESQQTRHSPRWFFTLDRNLEAVKNNPDKFPHDYMFEISEGEFADLRSKFSATKFAKTSVNGNAIRGMREFLEVVILLKELSRTRIRLMKEEKRTGYHWRN